MSCASNKEIHLDNYEDKMIIFGSGGGFAGIENRYCLLENGNLYKVSFPDNKGHKLGKIKSNLSKQLILNMDHIQKHTPEMNQPGNVYRFIEYHENDGKKTYIWNNTSDQNQELTILHSILMKYQNELSTSKNEL